MKIGYARVSTADQSLNLQYDALRAAGCECIFEDRISGKTRKRPGLLDMFRTLNRGDTLVVWRLDRIGRNFRHLVDIAEELRQREINLVSLSEGIDTSSNLGEVIFRLMSVFSDFERNVIVERTVAGLAAAKARGVKLGRRQKLSADEINEAWHLVNSNIPLETVAHRFNVGRATLFRYFSARPST